MKANIFFDKVILNLFDVKGKDKFPQPLNIPVEGSSRLLLRLEISFFEELRPPFWQHSGNISSLDHPQLGDNIIRLHRRDELVEALSGGYLVPGYEVAISVQGKAGTGMTQTLADRLDAIIK